MTCGQKMKEINKCRLLRKSSPPDIRITMRYPTTLDMIRCGGIFCMWDISYYVLGFYIMCWDFVLYVGFLYPGGISPHECVLYHKI